MGCVLSGRHRVGGGLCAVGQGELAAFVPVEPHAGLVFAERAQPGDEAGFAVVWDDGHLSGIVRDDLLVARVVADERLSDKEVTSAADGDVAFFRFFVVDPGDTSHVGCEVGAREEQAGLARCAAHGVNPFGDG